MHPGPRAVLDGANPRDGPPVAAPGAAPRPAAWSATFRPMLRLSVLLPVRNARPWLDASIASLSRQTFRDFEIVAVDDASTDGSLERLRELATREPRLRVIAGERAGLPRTLQTALAAARAPLLARHDADDLSHRERFALQIAHLGRHADVDVLGSRVRLFAHRDTPVGAGMRRWAAWHDSLLDHDSMHREALIDSPLAHGTAVIRRAALDRIGGWREEGWAEDLDLWLRLFESGARFAKLPRRLYAWRQHPGSSTRTDPRYATERFTALKSAALARGLLAGGRRASLVGTGASLERWRQALGSRVTRAHAAGRPAADVMLALRPPIVLVFVSAEARARWRRALAASGFSEMTDFVFVA